MHSQDIRYQGIKPSNIIHRGNIILSKDFSSSNTFAVGHTTCTDNPWRSSSMYPAPELTYRSFTLEGLSSHGQSTGIFALGCVFCVMLGVWQGQSLTDLHNHLSRAKGAENRPF
ncbi:hypothetical protein HBI56_116850 [Parastagonospora nodorum]|uniref:Protein kinase domain-containing protein n=1 Tax=Phaeosphaeria nodorum (strain SN15 / ATCC MYA-4574 / FGSC 10173) TaxID=321614 RepID=A0A7U2I3S5_PHANO|nr:hypothetical protein HBH56_199770 [Parastagonospora nodorum]QRD00725.1 hypothetical protein JI435_438520 [Parastagonospora nodorum SN15]KAH3925696.1 hypothetical protein HBH54_176530 [Parastagonospora nodorum]KAH3953023.1 hypothetical protein HBH53_037910 [Parastagonospora nodorum]KAH3976158.1 hypothetical protein HBH52_120740 [Parastagonospora nodorum]